MYAIFNACNLALLLFAIPGGLVAALRQSLAINLLLKLHRMNVEVMKMMEPVVRRCWAHNEVRKTPIAGKKIKNGSGVLRTFVQPPAEF